MNTENMLAQRAHKNIYRNGDTVVKEFDANFPKTDVLNEALNQARVEETCRFRRSTALPLRKTETGASFLTILKAEPWKRSWKKIPLTWRST